MKTSVSFKNTIVDIICLLYILLFVYAAVSKLIDFENFRVQLGQSPLLSTFAGLIAWIVPVLELFLALLISLKKWRIIGLFGALSLMIMFTTYIFIILNYSSFVPCSCGGILEKMGWKEHSLFNVVFIMLAAAGILILVGGVPKTHLISKPAALASSFLITSVFSISIITLLFILSEDVIHHRNNFVRRFPHHPVEFIKDFTLDNASSYIAGASKGKLHIGNFNDPLLVTEIDISSKVIKKYRIKVEDPYRPYKAVKITVNAPHFYLSDGNEAFIYRGLISDWNAIIWIDKAVYFNAFVPIDSNHAAFRALSSTTGENILGLIKTNPQISIQLKSKFLEKQIDGVFDTDGRLLYNSFHKKIIYLYTYRNEYLIMDRNLSKKDIGHTIDTTSKANITVTHIKSSKTTKLSSPARVVNKYGATDGSHLYVNAALIGRFEPRNMWDQASIIDVYDFMKHRYLFSFYLYDKNGRKISELSVNNGNLYALAGNTATLYHLDNIAFQRNR